MSQEEEPQVVPKCSTGRITLLHAPAVQIRWLLVREIVWRLATVTCRPSTAVYYS